MNCGKCKRTIDDGEERKLRSEVLCDDCYIDRIWPSTARRKWIPHLDAGSMRFSWLTKGVRTCAVLY